MTELVTLFFVMLLVLFIVYVVETMVYNQIKSKDMEIIFNYIKKNDVRLHYKSDSFWCGDFLIYRHSNIFYRYEIYGYGSVSVFSKYHRKIKKLHREAIEIRLENYKN